MLCSWWIRKILNLNLLWILRKEYFFFLESFQPRKELKLLHGTTCTVLNQSQEINSGVKLPLFGPLVFYLTLQTWKVFGQVTDCYGLVSIGSGQPKASAMYRWQIEQGSSRFIFCVFSIKQVGFSNNRQAAVVMKETWFNHFSRINYSS